MSQWLVEKSSALLEARTSRRGFLVRAAVAGSALAFSPFRYLLRPGSAYAAICAGCVVEDCACDSACCDGFTEFCCVVNNGVNACPPGTFEAGWWRADGSILCDGPRYYVDCNISCGCSGCHPCRCAEGNCDRRRTGCNQFRYGNCHTEIDCAGPIACRVVSCTPPYELYPACNQTTLWDDSTANHRTDCPSPPPPPGPGSVVAAHSGKVLDVNAASQQDGALVQQWSSHGGPNQKWSAEPLGDGSHRIVSVHSGKVLDVAGASTADGAQVLQWSWHGGANQRWHIEALGDGSHRIVSVHSGKVLDVAGASSADGAQVLQWSWHGGLNQRWRGLEVPPQRTGNLVTAAHSGKALDVNAASQQDGALVQQWSSHGGPNQKWAAEPLGDGSYRIVAAHSGRVLDVAQASRADGGRIHQWSWHGGANQRWRVEALGDGTVRIVSVHSGKVLDVPAGSTADGTAIIQWTWHGGANQRWRGL